MSQTDVLNLGERPTEVPDSQRQVFELSCNFLWNRALVQEGGSQGQLKLAMDQSKVKLLYQSTRRDMVRMVREAELGADSTLGGSELFWMVVNHFFCSESGREFRLPVGAMPVHRLNTQGRVSVALKRQGGGLHSNPWLESMLLCLLDVSGVAQVAAWLPIYVTTQTIAQAMKNMRRRQPRLQAQWKAAGHDFSKYFYGGLYALLCEGLVRGEVRRMIGGRGGAHCLNEGWMEESKQAAVEMGFLPAGGVLSLVGLCSLQRAQVEVYGNPGHIQALLSVLPCFLENPTAILERMWYMQDFEHLRHHCCYCRYGDS